MPKRSRRKCTRRKTGPNQKHGNKNKTPPKEMSRRRLEARIAADQAKLAALDDSSDEEEAAEEEAAD